MKKLLNLFLIITFHFGYLEWGESNSSFIFQAEAEIFKKVGAGVESIAHPLIIIPFLGIVLLLITLFQPQPSKKLTLIGMACLGILMAVILLVGTLGLNHKVILSVIPFFIVMIFIIFTYKKSKKRNG